MGKLAIGRIINTRGLKGEVKVDNYSSFMKNRYKVGNEVYLSNDEVIFISMKITHFSYTKGFVYLYLDGITSIDEANKYREYTIYCLDDNLNENKNTYHFLTLKDMRVVSNNKVIGKVIDIESNGRQDLLRIDTGNKTFLMPFLDDFIENIDKDNKTIYVKGIEVLYED